VCSACGHYPINTSHWRRLVLFAGRHLARARTTMTSSFLVVVLLAVAVTSSRGASGNVTCPAECRCGVVSGAPSADCSGRQISDLASVVEHLHPDTQVCRTQSTMEYLSNLYACRMSQSNSVWNEAFLRSAVAEFALSVCLCH